MDDPWAHPHSAAKKLQSERHRLAGRLIARRVETLRVEHLWSSVIAPSRTIDDCVALGAELHKARCEKWIDFALLDLICFGRANEISSPGLEVLTRVAVLNLLRACCSKKPAKIGSELSKTKEVFSGQAVVDAIDTAKGFLCDFLTGVRVPSTPYMSRQQLIAALKGIKGMSEPSISRAINKTKAILVEEQIGENARFRHVDRETHLKILWACVDFLKSA
jgi:hypothetical protein